MSTVSIRMNNNIIADINVPIVPNTTFVPNLSRNLLSFLLVRKIAMNANDLYKSNVIYILRDLNRYTIVRYYRILDIL